MDIKKIVAEMTLEEKAGLCSGADFWHTKAVERLGVEPITMSDGPHGLRRQEEAGDHLGMGGSVPAVCFPAGCATAASFDEALVYELGQELGKECRAEGVNVLLGPAVNIKRSPLCGRNFEYYSEDPYLASRMAAAYIKGVQSRGVGTSLKHFLANNQEHRRMSGSSEMDERTLREIYLAAFEEAVKEGRPWTVMCSYNRINGTYAAQNRKFLTDVLRNEWGFDGFVVSDWGAVNDRPADLEAGLDLEMPSSFGHNDARIVEAVKAGRLSEKTLDQAVERILGVARKCREAERTEPYDKEAAHRLARRMAGECMVLLKNEGVLPLSKNRKTAFIGEFAAHPRYQGGGSSHINAFQTESAWELADKTCVTYAKGCSIKEDKTDEALLKEAVLAAKEAETAVVFAGLPDSYESEGYDRVHMRLPENQNELIRAVCEANPNTVVVLHNGSPVEMPWADQVKGILEAYLGGQAVGGAVLDVLYGEVNPSGHLAETFPLKLEDNPSYLYYRGEGDTVEYREGIFVGYRYYDKKKMDVLFPFGHGLSYTDFAFSNLKISAERIRDTDVLTVSVDIKNTGSRSGKAVAQLYVAPPQGEIIRPVRELKGFEKVELEAGESRTARFTLSGRAFSFYDTAAGRFRAPSGRYGIEIGLSSRDIRQQCQVELEESETPHTRVGMDTIFLDILRRPAAVPMVREMVAKMDVADAGNGESMGEGTAEMLEALLGYMPLHALVSFSGGKIGFDDIEEFIEKLNGSGIF